MTSAVSAVVRASHTRLALTSVALMLALADLGIKTLATSTLADGPNVDLGVLELRLAYNPGVAFSLGDTLPSAIVIAATALIIAGIGVLAWRTAPTTPLLGRTGLAAILGGAAANLVDRAMDGVVTDYLHTGWWPTFNLADVFITCGGALVVLVHLRSPAGDREEVAT
ncbi:signal peptidase II [Saccharopolyspora sp. ID03-671]|uniref:signal peptidase II n=1 Tax=Saccharopolyspora sp. ID03-671 TaxID=3073066 RepID=UPI00324C4CC9